MDLMNPCGVFTPRSAPLTPRVALTPSTVIGLLDNSKKNADVLLRRLQQRLADVYGVEQFRWLKKEAARPADLGPAFIDECDAAVAAVCD